jgi:rhodanese-related sulfurtransferase
MNLFYIFFGVVVLFYLWRTLQARTLRHYEASELSDKLARASSDIVILDVRTERERRSKSISGSIHIPLNELKARLGELKKNQGKEIVCYCASGNRSVSAALKLKKAGFKSANLKGGIAEWSFYHR